MVRLNRLLVCLVIVVWISSPSAVDAFTGSLDSSVAVGAGYDPGYEIEGTAYWVDPGTVTFDWTVSLLQPQGPWVYDYTLTVPSEDGALSHLIIESTPGFEGDNPMDIFDVGFADAGGSGTDEIIWEVGSHTAGGGANPDMPENVYGIKFESVGENSDLGTTFNVWFSSYRNPEWGDFYAKDGNFQGGDTCQAWNYGFLLEDPTDPIQDGSINYHIVRPNEDYIPELGTWLLLGCTGIFGAVVRRRKK